MTMDMNLFRLNKTHFTTIYKAEKVKVFCDGDSIIWDCDGFTMAVAHAEVIDIEDRRARKETDNAVPR